MSVRQYSQGINPCVELYPSLIWLICCVAQLMEDLEQLKVLENGFKIKVIVVNHCAHGVDEVEDVASIEKIIKETGLE